MDLPRDTPSTTPRLLLVDEQALVRSGIKLLIESQPGWSVVGETADRSEALVLAGRHQPDIVLLDPMRGGDTDLNLLPMLLSVAQNTRILLVTGNRDPHLHQQAMRLGAVGIVLKEHAGEVLLKAIEKVCGGEAWVERGMLAGLLSNMVFQPALQASGDGSARPLPLTEREREVVALIGEGLRNKQIAARLGVSETTVRHYLTSIFNKLHVSDRLELMLYAFRYGLAKPPR